MPKKKPDSLNRPARTLAELMEASKRLELRGRELMEQAKVLAAEVAEAKARSEDRRAKRKG